MPTAYQQRLKALWEGNPLANFAMQPEEQDPNILAPTAYNVKSPTNAAQDVATPVPMMTEMVEPSKRYQSALRNRLDQIGGMSQDATNRALAARQARLSAQQQELNNGGGYQGGGGSVGLTGNAARDAILKAAAGAVGLPYSWGGGNSKGASYGLSGSGERHGSSRIYGFDCSGLVQYAYAQAGMKMPRLAGQQAARGVRMPINKLVPGDLVGGPGHIAVYAGNGMMYEAPTFGKRVRLVPVRNGMFGVHFNF